MEIVDLRFAICDFKGTNLQSMSPGSSGHAWPTAPPPMIPCNGRTPSRVASLSRRTAQTDESSAVVHSCRASLSAPPVSPGTAGAAASRMSIASRALSAMLALPDGGIVSSAFSYATMASGVLPQSS